MKNPTDTLVEALRRHHKAYVDEHGSDKGVWNIFKESGISGASIGRIVSGTTKIPKMATWNKLYLCAPEIIPRPPWLNDPMPPWMRGEDGKDQNALGSDGESNPKIHRVPVFDAQGGMSGAWTDGDYPVGEAFDYEYLPENMVDRNSFIVTIHGESMVPTLQDGSRALIVPSRSLENGQLCFVSFPGDTGDKLVKRYYRYGDTVVLRSDNPSFQEITLDEGNGKGVRIFRVTWILP